MPRIDQRRKLFSCLETGGMTLLALLMTGLVVLGQEQAEKKFFEVKLGADTSFAFDRLSYQGDCFEFNVKAGKLVAGSTEKGMTVVIILGDIELKITPAKEEFEAAFKEHLGSAPAVILAKKAYLRLNPEDYLALTKGAKLTPNADENTLKTAKTLYDEKFNGSFHAGPLAIIPPARTFFCDLDAEKIGPIIFEEGDFLRLTRVIPYKAIYPSRTINPKR
jgi:hypothetical protein